MKVHIYICFFGRGRSLCRRASRALAFMLNTSCLSLEELFVRLSQDSDLPVVDIFLNLDEAFLMLNEPNSACASGLGFVK